MSSVPVKTVAQSLTLRPHGSNLPLIAAAAGAGLNFLGALLARLSPHRRDEPGAAELRDLGLDHQPPAPGFDFVDIQAAFETTRLHSLGSSQTWRGS